mgnify:CR=1 FL=1
METKELEFTRMVNEHKRTIYTVCYMFSKDVDEVNDLFQEVLIRLWNGFDTFRGESDVKTWIWRVSLNTCINQEKKKSRLGQRVDLSVDINPYEDDGRDAQQIRQLYNRINRLGLVDRSIILLWLEGMCYDEIGAIMGISAKNVSVKLVRIREQLKQMSDD